MGLYTDILKMGISHELLWLLPLLLASPHSGYAVGPLFNLTFVVLNIAPNNDHAISNSLYAKLQVPIDNFRPHCLTLGLMLGSYITNGNVRQPQIPVCSQ